MSGAEVLDEYLDGLLQMAAPAPATLPAAAAAPARSLADDVIADMLSDPAFAEPASPTPVESVSVADELIAEMDADPAFATTATAPVSDPTVAALLAEMDADPAFAPAGVDATSIATTSRPAHSEPTAAAKPSTISKPGPARRTVTDKTAPRHIQALFPPADTPQIEAQTQAERSSRWLRLRCGEQTYALELLKVQEVVLSTPLLRLRGTARAMLGIMNLRGLVVPVLDLGLYLGTEPVEVGAGTRVVVLEENGETIGLRVSAVEDVTTLTGGQIEPPDDTRLCRISNRLFRGVARLGHQPMILLDASKLLH